MNGYQDGTNALGAFVFSGTDGRAEALIKPTTAGDYQIVVAGALPEYTGTYDLRVRPYKDDHYPNSVESESEISFPEDSDDSDSFPSASESGKINYAFDSDWFKVSDLAPGQRYVLEARHGRHYLLIKIYDAEGDRVESSYDGQRVIFVPPADQEYFIRVYPGNRFNRARYTLYIHKPISLGPGAELGGRLTLDPSQIFDPDGTTRAERLNAWRYEWYCIDGNGGERRIPRARSSSYQPVAADIDHKIVGRICYSDDRFTAYRECRSSEPGRAAILRTLPYDFGRAPPGIEAGGKFRWLVVSYETRTAEETNIEVYDDWIHTQLQASPDPLLRENSHYYSALVSTAAVSALDHTETRSTGQSAGTPIYWHSSPHKVADDYRDFWDGSWDHRDPGVRTFYDTTNNISSTFNFSDTDYVWTGTASDGSGLSGYELGRATAAAARPDSGAGYEVNSEVRATTNQHFIYGLSRVFLVDEPDGPYVLRVGGVAITSTPEIDTDSDNIPETYGVDEVIEFTVTFSEPVEVTGDPEFQFTMNTSADRRRAAYTSGSGTAALVFKYTVLKTTPAVRSAGRHRLVQIRHSSWT